MPLTTTWSKEGADDKGGEDSVSLDPTQASGVFGAESIQVFSTPTPRELSSQRDFTGAESGQALIPNP